MSPLMRVVNVGCVAILGTVLASCSDASQASTEGSSTASNTSAQGATANATNTSRGGSSSASSTTTSGGGSSSTNDSTSSATTSSAAGATANSTTGAGNVTGGSDAAGYGEVFSGGEFHLGPVDWAESEWTNSCSPYPEAIQELEGDFLAGLELTHNGDGQLCDACVELVAETGKSIVARVITTGVTTPNSIDLSPEAFAALDSGEYPRAMTWQVVKCPDTGNLHYQFQTEANVWWTSLWVRNARVPIEKIEVQSANHDDWFALTRGSDGTYTDNSGFGDGPFTLRVTGIDGQTVEDSFDSFSPGDLVESSGNFE